LFTVIIYLIRNSTEYKFLQKLTVVQVVRKFHSLYANWSFMAAFKRTLHCLYRDIDVSSPHYYTWFANDKFLIFPTYPSRWPRDILYP
jgi:hypothetical protein